jgi:hypothetical protein
VELPGHCGTALPGAQRGRGRAFGAADGDLKLVEVPALVPVAGHRHIPGVQRPAGQAHIARAVGFGGFAFQSEQAVQVGDSACLGEVAGQMTHVVRPRTAPAVRGVRPPQRGLERKLTDFTAAHLVRHVAHLVDSVGRQGMTALASELADAAKLLQYRYDAPAWQGRNGTRPDNGIPAVDLMRRVTWEGNGFLAVSAGGIRRTYGAGWEPLARGSPGTTS